MKWVWKAIISRADKPMLIAFEYNTTIRTNMSWPIDCIGATPLEGLSDVLQK